MIVFDLACECGFQFEGWFRDHNDYEKQVEAGFLVCPDCGSAVVHKILSPVAVHRKGTKEIISASLPFVDQKDLTPEKAEKAIKVLQDYVIKNFEDVGPHLAETALKIHYGVEEARNVRGVATVEEEKVLNKEGIELLKIPLPQNRSDQEIN